MDKAKCLHLVFPKIFNVNCEPPFSSNALELYAERSKERLCTRLSGVGNKFLLFRSIEAIDPKIPLGCRIHSSLRPKAVDAIPDEPSQHITNLRPDMLSTRPILL